MTGGRARSYARTNAFKKFKKALGRKFNREERMLFNVIFNMGWAKGKIRERKLNKTEIISGLTPKQQTRLLQDSTFKSAEDYIDKEFLSEMYKEINKPKQIKYQSRYESNITICKCGSCGRTHMSNLPFTTIYEIYKCNSCVEGFSEDQLNKFLFNLK